MSALAERLRAAIRHRGLSLRKFQKLIAHQYPDVKGTSYPSFNSYINKDEAKAVEPSLGFLKATAEITGVRPLWLAYGEGEMTDAAHDKATSEWMQRVTRIRKAILGFDNMDPILQMALVDTAGKLAFNQHMRILRMNPGPAPDPMVREELTVAAARALWERLLQPIRTEAPVGAGVDDAFTEYGLAFFHAIGLFSAMATNIFRFPSVAPPWS